MDHAGILKNNQEVGNMKKYKIIKNFDEWLPYDVPNEKNTIIDEEELQRLAADWEKTVDELKEDLEEIE